MRGASPLLLLAAAVAVRVRALGTNFRAATFNMSVDAETVTECGNVKFEWSGGVPPYQLIVMGPTRPVTIYNVPSGSGNSAEWVNPYLRLPDMEQKTRIQEIMFYMTDANQDRASLPQLNPTVGHWPTNQQTDVTDLIPVGARTAGAPSCKVIDGAPDWFFQMETQGSTLDQCSSLELSWRYADKVVTPVTSLLAIPNGMVYTWESASEAVFTDYKVNVQSGARVVFSLWDSMGKTGGASDVLTISPTSDKSCLDRNTLNITSGEGAVVNEPSNSKSGSGGISKGAIIGLAVGIGVGLLCIFGVLLWWLRKRWQKGRVVAQEVVDLYEPTEDHTPQTSQTVTPFIASGPPPTMSDPRTSMSPSDMSYLTSQQHGGGPASPPSTFTGYSESAYGSDHRYSTPAGGASRLSAKAAEAQNERAALLLSGPGGSAPAGPAIIRMHDDAGPLSPQGQPATIHEEVIDLPPNYQADWQQPAASSSSSPLPPGASVPPNA